ncbi:hypothetical protein DFJ74DRAFT_693805 [Hyaloraphidium curvatum]|nr:hypothetical protein DFJ74DRAFT_693805 [Hyaloraphidium curvatum]
MPSAARLPGILAIHILAGPVWRWLGDAAALLADAVPTAAPRWAATLMIIMCVAWCILIPHLADWLLGEAENRLRGIGVSASFRRHGRPRIFSLAPSLELRNVAVQTSGGLRVTCEALTLTLNLYRLDIALAARRIKVQHDEEGKEPEGLAMDFVVASAEVSHSILHLVRARARNLELFAGGTGVRLRLWPRSRPDCASKLRFASFEVDFGGQFGTGRKQLKLTAANPCLSFVGGGKGRKAVLAGSVEASLTWPIVGTEPRMVVRAHKLCVTNLDDLDDTPLLNRVRRTVLGFTCTGPVTQPADNSTSMYDFRIGLLDHRDGERLGVSATLAIPRNAAHAMGSLALSITKLTLSRNGHELRVVADSISLKMTMLHAFFADGLPTLVLVCDQLHFEGGGAHLPNLQTNIGTLRLTLWPRQACWVYGVDLVLSDGSTQTEVMRHLAPDAGAMASLARSFSRVVRSSATASLELRPYEGTIRGAKCTARLDPSMLPYVDVELYEGGLDLATLACDFGYTVRVDVPLPFMLFSSLGLIAGTIIGIIQASKGGIAKGRFTRGQLKRTWMQEVRRLMAR